MKIKTQEDFDKELINITDIAGITSLRGSNIFNRDQTIIINFLLDVVKSLLPTEKGLKEIAKLEEKIEEQRKARKLIIDETEINRAKRKEQSENLDRLLSDFNR